MGCSIKMGILCPSYRVLYAVFQKKWGGKSHFCTSLNVKISFLEMSVPILVQSVPNFKKG